MSISIPSSLVEFILLGPVKDRRQLQDSPILGDVLVEFGKGPGERLDLLISPYRGQHAGSVAAAIDDGLGHEDDGDDNDDLARIAFLQGLVVAELTFEEVMRVVVPKTKWWTSRWKKTAGLTTAEQKASSEWVHDVMAYDTPDKVKALLEKILTWTRGAHSRTGKAEWLPEAFDRFLALAGVFVWAVRAEALPSLPKDAEPDLFILAHAIAHVDEISTLLVELANGMLKESRPDPQGSIPSPLVFLVSRNRGAEPALSKSIPAVKADAAKTLFKVNCSEIGWAVIDSGIDGAHPAFCDGQGNSRVKRSFDFKNLRTIVSLRNARPAIAEKSFKTLMEHSELLKHPPSEEDGKEALQRLAIDARNRGPVHWELVEKFVEIKPGIPETRPVTNHGTHVAGIIGANKKAAEERAGQENDDFADGMCPDILLYDFRVLGTDISDTEFQIIAALQFIRYLNERDNFFTIHGANLSLSIPHNVRNFACGRTPICDECDRLVASGVVVVAAAGNQGYQSFETKVGSFDSYAAFSITDPGNADSVLTVGATHRFWPHTYGVSFFSSRGPTGDGRLKPDLVAPGERIRAPLPGDYERGGDWGDLDGTSMAAPHVSGAAAMLMARYSELVGQPLRIKRILCESATDLARERSFQGHGMLDVLRAFQSI